MIYLFTTRISKLNSYNHFFYDSEQKMFMSVIYDCYSFVNKRLHVSYIGSNNLIYNDKIMPKLTVNDNEVFLVDEKYRKMENRLMMCEQVWMTKILESI